MILNYKYFGSQTPNPKPKDNVAFEVSGFSESQDAKSRASSPSGPPYGRLHTGPSLATASHRWAGAVVRRRARCEPTPVVVSGVQIPTWQYADTVYDKLCLRIARSQRNGRD